MSEETAKIDKVLQDFWKLRLRSTPARHGTGAIGRGLRPDGRKPKTRACERK